jgi:hypothetical protein
MKTENKIKKKRKKTELGREYHFGPGNSFAVGALFLHHTGPTHQPRPRFRPHVADIPTPHCRLVTSPTEPHACSVPLLPLAAPTSTASSSEVRAGAMTTSPTAPHDLPAPITRQGFDTASPSRGTHTLPTASPMAGRLGRPSRLPMACSLHRALLPLLHLCVIVVAVAGFGGNLPVPGAPPYRYGAAGARLRRGLPPKAVLHGWVRGTHALAGRWVPRLIAGRYARGRVGEENGGEKSACCRGRSLLGLPVWPRQLVGGETELVWRMCDGSSERMINGTVGDFSPSLALLLESAPRRRRGSRL